MDMLLLEDRTEISEIKEIATQAYQRSENVRKGIFKKYAELAKMYMELRQDMDVIKAGLCKGKI